MCTSVRSCVSGTALADTRIRPGTRARQVNANPRSREDIQVCRKGKADRVSQDHTFEIGRPTLVLRFEKSFWLEGVVELIVYFEIQPKVSTKVNTSGCHDDFP